MTRAYYQSHRLTIISKTRIRHIENSRRSRTYCVLVQVRKDIWRLRESVSSYRHKIALLQQRIERLVRRKEELELRWGKERAERKRNDTRTV